jgi:hypothetical protein
MMYPLRRGHVVTEVEFERKPWWVFWRGPRIGQQRRVLCFCPLSDDREYVKRP